MKPILLTALAALSIGAVAAPALAQPRWGEIHDKEARIDARIHQGMRSGDLTRHEAFVLRRQLRDIQDLERHDRRVHGGRLTDRDLFDLQTRVDQLSAQVFHERHDDQRAGDHHDRDHRGY